MSKLYKIRPLEWEPGIGSTEVAKGLDENYTVFTNGDLAVLKHGWLEPAIIETGTQRAAKERAQELHNTIVAYRFLQEFRA